MMANVNRFGRVVAVRAAGNQILARSCAQAAGNQIVASSRIVQVAGIQIVEDNQIEASSLIVQAAGNQIVASSLIVQVAGIRIVESNQIVASSLIVEEAGNQIEEGNQIVIGNQIAAGAGDRIVASPVIGSHRDRTRLAAINRVAGHFSAIALSASPGSMTKWAARSCQQRTRRKLCKC